MNTAATGTAIALVRTVLVAAALGGAASADAKAEWPAPAASSATRCPFEPASGAWWSGFNDSVLNLLHAMATRRGADASPRNDGCAPVALTAAYVQVRVLTVRMAVLQSMLTTTGRQAALIGNSKDSGNAQADGAHGVLEQRVEATATQLRNITLQRLHFLQVLSLQTGLPEAQMTEMLQPTLREQTLPRFFMNLPAQLPDRMRSDVAQDLRNLSDRTKAAAMLGQLVDNRRAEFELTRQRQQMGQASELESAERYFVMLADTDRLAAVNGELVLAWIDLQRSTGGSIGKEAARDGASAQPESR